MLFYYIDDVIAEFLFLALVPGLVLVPERRLRAVQPARGDWDCVGDWSCWNEHGPMAVTQITLALYCHDVKGLRV